MDPAKHCRLTGYCSCQSILVAAAGESLKSDEVDRMDFSNHPQPNSRNLRTPKSSNELWQYLQAQGSQSPQELAQQVSEDALEILSHHIRGMLGTLPSEQFDVQVVTNRESLAQLLSGAMLTGYYLRAQEQKLHLEHAIGLHSNDGSSEGDRTSN